MTTSTARNTLLEAVERKRTLREEAQAKAREQDAWEEQAQRETMDLARLRGEMVEGADQRRGEGRKPLRRITGLQWLLRKERITAKQFQAGTQYGNDWRQCEEMSVKSCLASMESVDGGRMGGTESDFKLAARNRLTKARIIGLRSHPGMISVCDIVCGVQETVRDYGGDRETAERAEAVLSVALDLLEEHYGL